MAVPLPTLSRSRAALAALLFALIAVDLSAGNTSSVGGSQGLPLGQPGLGLRFMIAVAGEYPSHGPPGTGAGEMPMIGEIRLFAFTNPTPGGWMDCDGSYVAIAPNAALFSVIGTAFGGDGVTVFRLPDLRGRVPVGRGASIGSGLTSHAMGEQFGAATAPLTVANLSSHLHTMAGAQTGVTGSNAAFPLWRPSLALNPLIAPNNNSQYFNYQAEIRWFAGDFEPEAWVFADGRVMPIASYTYLFSKIGTTYGGNGTTVFNLPPLLGRAETGAGQPPGGTNHVSGETPGAESAALTLTTLASHAHATAAGPTGSSGGSTPIDRFQPSLVTDYMIALSGIFPSSSTVDPEPDPFVGEIRPVAGGSVPSEFVLCQGQALPIASNSALFSLLGVSFGGDGVNYFNLPDLRGRVPIGIGQGAGLPYVQLGDVLGAEASAMTVAQMPAHLHSQPPPAITVRGNGTVIANGDTTPSLGDFTEFTPVDVAGGATTRDFTVSNGGLGDLALSASLSGSAAFAVAIAPGAVVAPGSSTTLQLAFDPTAEGTFTSTATISNDDPGNGPFTFRVEGNGANNLSARHPGALRAGNLRVTKNGTDATRVDLAWGSSCQSYATGYAAYEGQLGNFTSHALLPGQCNVSSPATGIVPGSGNRYFLVSAIDGLALEEGSLGQSSTGAEYLHPAGACQAATDLASCAAALPVGSLNGAATASTFEISAQTPLPTLGWTALSGAAQVYDLASNGGLVGATSFGNYQVEYQTGVPIAANSLYQLRVDMGFMAGITGGSATYQLELGTTSGGVFTPLQSVSGTVNYAGNLSGGVISGNGMVFFTTGSAVSGNPLTVRWRQASNPGPSDYFGIDNVTLSVAN